MVQSRLPLGVLVEETPDEGPACLRSPSPGHTVPALHPYALLLREQLLPPLPGHDNDDAEDVEPADLASPTLGRRRNLLYPSPAQFATPHRLLDFAPRRLLLDLGSAVTPHTLGQATTPHTLGLAAAPHDFAPIVTPPLFRTYLLPPAESTGPVLHKLKTGMRKLALAPSLPAHPAAAPMFLFSLLLLLSLASNEGPKLRHSPWTPQHAPSHSIEDSVSSSLSQHTHSTQATLPLTPFPLDCTPLPSTLTPLRPDRAVRATHSRTPLLPNPSPLHLQVYTHERRRASSHSTVHSSGLVQGLTEQISLLAERISQRLEAFDTTEKLLVASGWCAPAELHELRLQRHHALDSMEHQLAELVHRRVELMQGESA